MSSTKSMSRPTSLVANYEPQEFEVLFSCLQTITPIFCVPTIFIDFIHFIRFFLQGSLFQVIPDLGLRNDRVDFLLGTPINQVIALIQQTRSFQGIELYYSRKVSKFQEKTDD